MFDVPALKWSESHGVDRDHQGAAVLYFGLPYMLRSARCVCLGSGAGFVPLQMLSAQRRLVREGLLRETNVVLVDADVGQWGRPVYKSGEDIDPDIRLVKQLTSDAVYSVGWINYLHIDADHSYEGVTADLEAYLPKLVGDWAVTVHDTFPPEGNTLPIGAWSAAKDFGVRHGFVVSNFRVGCGTALIRRGDG